MTNVQGNYKLAQQKTGSDWVTYTCLVPQLLCKYKREIALCSPTPSQSALKNRDRIQLTSDSLLEEKTKKIKARDEVC